MIITVLPDLCSSFRISMISCVDFVSRLPVGSSARIIGGFAATALATATDILVNEGYITKYDIVEEGNFNTIRITLKYGADKNEKVISGIKKISKPGLRVYAGKDELPRVLGGLGTAIISTNQGVITDKEARKLGVGGEVLCFVW